MFRIIPEGVNYSEHVILKDGTGLLLRPAASSDKKLIREFLNRLSNESLRMRFMASVSHVPDDTINTFCSNDFKDVGCLVATISEGDEEKIVGLGNYLASPNGRTAEVAFLIEDDFQGKGIGTILLERLAGIAAANGFIHFEAEVLPENIPMIKVFKSSGFKIHQVWGSDTVHLELPVEGAAAVWERAGLRERIAVANSIKPILFPKTIAVVGASRQENSIGNKMFRHLIEGNFKGTLFPINQQADSISGVKAYSSVEEVPEKIDLAIIAVSADKVNNIAKKVIAKGARGLVVVSAGFAEAGEEGKRFQDELVKIVRDNGVRLIGPSCLGIINTSPEISMNASLAPQIIKRGSAGFFSHSAALGIVILKYAQERGIGFTTFISAGNRADVSGNDLLQYWEEDPDTKYAILYLETFGNPRRFVRIARRMSYKKPILCVKSARSAIGMKTVASKKAGGGIISQNVLNALFAQTGMIVTETLEELFDVAVILSHQPLPRGNKAGIIANSAGMSTLFADAGEAYGISISEENLLNLGAFAAPDDYMNAVEKLLLSDEVESLLIGFAGLGRIDPHEILNGIKEGIAKVRSKVKDFSKPIVLCFMGEYGTLSLVDENNILLGELPSFRFPEAASRALGRVIQYSNFLKTPAGKLIWYDDIHPEEAREIINDLFVQGSDDLIEIDKPLVEKIMNIFGLNLEEVTEGKKISIEVIPDPLFGPIIHLSDGGKLDIYRITPLTESDLAETMKEMDSSFNHSIADVIGRISQLIEELPWLWELKLEAYLSDKCRIKDAFISVKPGGSKLPNY